MTRTPMSLLAACVLALVVLVAQAATPKAVPGEVALDTGRGPVQLHIIHHASFVLDWNGRHIYVDPTGSPDLYRGLGAADMVLVTHAHGDHLSPTTLDGLDLKGAILVMPQSVADKIGHGYGETQRVMANGDSTSVDGITVQAVPMYNLTPGRMFHAKGWGNGYVLTLGGKRIYISGDTEGTPEMRALKDIDLAFVCMNLPYTMDVQHAADAVLAFKPEIVYPYHYRGQDPQAFKRLVHAGDPAIDVRLRDWYAK